MSSHVRTGRVLRQSLCAEETDTKDLITIYVSGDRRNTGEEVREREYHLWKMDIGGYPKING